MPTRLLVAPAANGKTEFVLGQARAAAGAFVSARILAPSPLQVNAAQRRLARTGGAWDVRLFTMNSLARTLLDEAGLAVTVLPDPVQVRLLRVVVDVTPLIYYEPLRSSPGFIQVLRGVFGELQSALITPESLAQALQTLAAPPRLTELAELYARYIANLRRHHWTDGAGLTAWALQALADKPGLARNWPLLLVDGFDAFTPGQLELLRILAERVGELVITATGDLVGQRNPAALAPFHETIAQIEAALGVRAEPLPSAGVHLAPALAHLERNLFARSDSIPADDALTLVAAADHEDEIRAALRWLKARHVLEGVPLAEMALLARDLSPYRHFVVQTAVEFGLPVQVVGGLPLRQNPAIAALLDLLGLVHPTPESAHALPFREVVAAWRSPYFDWAAHVSADISTPVGIEPGDADRLDAAGRWGRVMGGWAQWRETLTLLAERDGQAEDDDDVLSAQTPSGAEAQALLAKLTRFVARLRPPPGPQPASVFVCWLEDLIGPDPTTAGDDQPAPAGDARSLRMVDQARAAGDALLAARDLAALNGLKDILRGILWAASALNSPDMDYAAFLQDLAGAVDAASYAPSRLAADETLLVADVVQGRGLALTAAAIVGLAEGLFPAVLRSDPYLRESDRLALRSQFGLPIGSSLRNTEASHFYEAICRPSQRLLLTRPRVSDTGAEWQESPYWQEVRHLIETTPLALSHEYMPGLGEAASWPELMQLLARAPDNRLYAWVQAQCPDRLTAWERATVVAVGRYTRADSPHDGELSAWATEFGRRFGPRHVWSPSRLEAYQACPFLFFTSHILDIQPRSESKTGLDAAQVGAIYHDLLKQAYASAFDPTDAASVIAALDRLAQPYLQAAPQRHGFRPTAWWAQTQIEILGVLHRTIEALIAGSRGWRPARFEAGFGDGSLPPAQVGDGDDAILYRGRIDRVDVDGQGHARIIDYKSSGATSHNLRSLQEGRRLQLPLYAWAAQEVVGAGKVVEGFYWDVVHAKMSSLQLANVPAADGEDAVATGMAMAFGHTCTIARQTRQGHFAPKPPADGCPPYCPAADFCWRYRSGSY